MEDASASSATVDITKACVYANEGQTEEAVALARRARTTATTLPRQARQRVEILAAALEGQLRRAVGLTFEHFAEFGPDVLVLDQLAAALQRQPDRRLGAALAALADQHPPPP
jgi:hypothetical protein